MGGEAEGLEAQITTLSTWISESQHIVFFGGAGASTESGIPDFRSSDGLLCGEAALSAGADCEPQLFPLAHRAIL